MFTRTLRLGLCSLFALVGAPVFSAGNSADLPNLGATVNGGSDEGEKHLVMFRDELLASLKIQSLGEKHILCKGCDELGATKGKMPVTELKLSFPGNDAATAASLVTAWQKIQQRMHSLTFKITLDGDPEWIDGGGRPACTPPYPNPPCKAKAYCQLPPPYATPGCTKTPPTCTACTL